MFPESFVRTLTALLGVANVVFGAWGVATPKMFARTFDLPAHENPVQGSIVRSLAVRDLAMGIGLWSAAVHGGRITPLIMMRIISDGADTLGLLAVPARQRSVRLNALVAIAGLAAFSDVVLYVLARNPRED